MVMSRFCVIIISIVNVVVKEYMFDTVVLNPLEINWF